MPRPVGLPPTTAALIATRASRFIGRGVSALRSGTGVRRPAEKERGEEFSVFTGAQRLLGRSTCQATADAGRLAVRVKDDAEPNRADGIGIGLPFNDR